MNLMLSVVFFALFLWALTGIDVSLFRPKAAPVPAGNLEVTLRPRSSSYSVGQKAEIEMYVGGAVNFYGFETDVRYDSTKLSYTGVRYQSFFTGNDDGTYFSLGPKVEGDKLINIAATKLNTNVVNGDGVIAVIEFDVVGSGNPTVSIENYKYINNSLDDYNVIANSAQVNLVSSGGSTPTPIASCPTDLFTCPNGSTVGRVFPSCSFASCPGGTGGGGSGGNGGSGGGTTFRPSPSDYGLTEGDVISSFPYDNDFDVYIVNELGFKRLFLDEIIFSYYGHLGFEKVVHVTPTVRDLFETSGIFRNCETGDDSVYGVEVVAEDLGRLHHVQLSGQQAYNEDSEFFNKVFCINNNEFNDYTHDGTVFGNPWFRLADIPAYSRF